MASDSFKTFIPLSVDTEAKAAIITDFFDLLSAVAAHGKVNGFGGRKLSRMAAWWAFEHKETGSGFEGGYKEWLRYGSTPRIRIRNGRGTRGSLLTNTFYTEPLMPQATSSSPTSGPWRRSRRVVACLCCPCLSRSFFRRRNTHPSGRP